MTRAGALTLTRNPANGLLLVAALGSIAENRSYTSFGEIETLSDSVNCPSVLTLDFDRDGAGRVVKKT